MRCSELTGLLPKYRISPAQVCECAAQTCSSKFAFIEGLAFPGCSATDGKPRLYFFCSATCYLDSIPPEGCGTA